MNATKTFSDSDLANFYGSENSYFNPLVGKAYTYTDGVKFISDRGCGWMVSDILVIVAKHPRVKDEEFVSIKFIKKNKKGETVIRYEDGNYKLLYSQTYAGTDCPVDEINFYFENGMLMLVTER